MKRDIVRREEIRSSLVTLSFSPSLPRFTHLHAVHLLPAEAAATHTACREGDVTVGGLHEPLQGRNASVADSSLLLLLERRRISMPLLPRAEQRHRSKFCSLK